MTTRTADELAAVDNPAWPAVVDLVERASVPVTVLALNHAAGKASLYRLQVAAASALGAVASNCAAVVVSTVHDVQVLEPGDIPMTANDVRLDLIVAPTRVIWCTRDCRPAAGIRCDDLTEEKIAAIPLLQRLRPPT